MLYNMIYEMTTSSPLSLGFKILSHAVSLANVILLQVILLNLGALLIYYSTRNDTGEKINAKLRQLRAL